jgi:uroporphyrin-III C-methyltransferase/precorrin-2 dehydrogenase/sirohydrochlorin ferrochelatase
MEHFPIFLDLAGRDALVVGGGPVAARKADLLARAGARVTFVAPGLAPAAAALVAGGRARHRAEAFAPDMIAGNAVVIAATDSLRVNESVSRAAGAIGVPVNVVDDAALSSFIMPSVIDRAPVTIAVSTGGVAPVLARLLRARIEAAVPAGFGRLARLAARLRRTVRLSLPDLGARRRFWEGVFEGRVAELVFAGREDEAEALFRGDLDRAGEAEARGEVFLVGAGPGDPELLTFRALRLLQSADAIVHDSLVPHAILDLARREAERIDAGKRCGKRSAAQADINALMVRLARAGKRVVRLKGGDPFLFGRGGEEVEALAAEGVPVRVVPGVTAAMGCAAAAGIPLTHRDHAHAVVFVSGHRRAGAPDPDWAALAQPDQTLVIYMGVGTIAETAAKLVAHGMPASTPAAAIENGTLPDERVIAGTLATLPSRIAEAGIAGPALIVVGSVVALRDRAALPAHRSQAAVA